MLYTEKCVLSYYDQFTQIRSQQQQKTTKEGKKSLWDGIHHIGANNKATYHNQSRPKLWWLLLIDLSAHQ